ncbi:hypothetical protein OsccyDRAFT_4842 [Leptolyngbyaceae cyanobacterium JSC-12]|nr:hypothetical protein OsccyDRAFT_4842 [Leptolyngbyaceae cyanobacterium JSC-12]
MPPESSLNVLISLFLLAQFLQVVPIQQIRHKDAEIVIGARVRIPNLLVLTEELAAIWQPVQRSTITPDMPAPLLVVKVVSLGKMNKDRDYRYKRSEYATRGTPEYWIVDPVNCKVTILALVDGLYEETIFQGADAIASAVLPSLHLTATQILTAGQ